MSKRNKSNLALHREWLGIDEEVSEAQQLYMDNEPMAKEMLAGIRQTQEIVALEKLLCYKNISTKQQKELSRLASKY